MGLKENHKFIFLALIFIVFFLMVLSLKVFGFGQEFSLQASVKVLGPVIITINSPVDRGIYDIRRILLDVSVSEKVKRLDYNVNGGSFRMLCKECNSYSKYKVFGNGENNLIVRAEAYDGNTYYESVSFTVSSRFARFNFRKNLEKVFNYLY